MTKSHEAKTILIIEDEVDVLNFVARLLELEGYRVIPSEDGEEGLRLAREREVSLVLLDLRMPGHDGWWVLSQMKNDPELSTIPVIVVTASAAERERKRALQAGAADYLVKPVRAASLREAVIRSLKEKR